MAPPTVKIMIVDDHEMFLDGIITLLNETAHLKVLYRAGDGKEAIVILNKHAKNVDVLLTDISMPGIAGDDLSKLISKDYPHIKILALSMHSDSKTVKNTLKNGAKGYILKNAGKAEQIGRASCRERV